MYEHIGAWSGRTDWHEDLARVVWNPPGWGSVEVTGPWKLGQLIAMRPGAHIPFHQDDPATEHGDPAPWSHREHIVLSTNDACWNYHGGTWQQLDAGQVYRMDPTQVHASINLGDSLRVHLVVDY